MKDKLNQLKQKQEALLGGGQSRIEMHNMPKGNSLLSERSIFYWTMVLLKK